MVSLSFVLLWSKPMRGCAADFRQRVSKRVSPKPRYGVPHSPWAQGPAGSPPPENARTMAQRTKWGNRVARRVSRLPTVAGCRRRECGIRDTNLSDDSALQPCPSINAGCIFLAFKFSQLR